jgi:hypothetical protein
MRVLQNRVQRRMFGPRKKKPAGGGELCGNKRHDLYCHLV